VNDFIEIGDYRIGTENFIFMIAEIGINHNGDLQIAKKLIDASFASNFHCVKFQKREPEIAVPEEQKNIMRDTPWGMITYLEYRQKVELGEQEYRYVDVYCKEKPILWSASVWDLPSLDFLLLYNVPFLKIPSAKLTDMDLLIQACKSGKPVLLSTGMSTLKEVDEAVNCLEKYTSGDYVLMHTNSSYPAADNELNLNLISMFRQRYQCIVGYSGHEYGLEPTAVAVILGAKVIERHITLDHNMWGTDQRASLEVHAMDLLHKRIKNIHMMLGDGVKRVTEKEEEVRKKLRGC
jgi:N-acetylneuraminate synthase